ncbi:HEAT repeat-containing protein 6 isoform X2 [Quercus lobata]|uniref:HEAT repeat-containing protein 6 isoform X2 n=2 Tax=Quercus lobata TaxID=97700 RepID=UPI0012440112|nr:HEAT repeat-containing protein 6 isoform X2 [Quercus lobata]
MASSSSTTGVRSWRTAFLTLRDETLTSHSPHARGGASSSSIHQLLHHLIFSHSQSFISAAPQLPPHEVTSDLLFLLELVNAHAPPDDITDTFTLTSHLIHDVCLRVSFDLNPSSWTLILDSFTKMLQYLIHTNAASVASIIECLHTIKRLTSLYHRKCSPSEDTQLVKFLLSVISRSHTELLCSSNSIKNQRRAADKGKKMPRYSSLWEVQTLAFTMLGDTVSSDGSSIPVDIWKLIIEVFRKVMDFLASKSLLVGDTVMSRFYASLLHCLHLVLKDPKGSLSDHLTGFVAALRMFFTYGLESRTQITYPAPGNQEKELRIMSKSSFDEPKKVEHSPYRPPHLRKKDTSYMRQKKSQNSQSSSDHESSTVDFTSSDSDYSDSDGSVKESETVWHSKVRVAAIVCIQDLCQVDSKSFTTQWTLLLPTSDVLQLRKFEATLMTCLLYDPYLKARIASASALAVMLDGPSTIFLQVAEYKESSKYGSFMALSSSLGQILMQLHAGILYLIQRETHSRLLASLFKILMLLVSSTPYSRMPGELLPTVITSLQTRINEGFSFKSDQTGLLAAAVSCLTAALSTSPSLQVREMLLEEISTGFLEAEKKSGVLFAIFQYSEQLTSPNICFEALQALRAVSHNYPNIMFACWERVSTIVYGFFMVATPEVAARPWKGNAGDIVGVIGEKVLTAAVKVLDECLRAISGFKGTEDLFDDRVTPFTSDCIRMKKVSSAPSYELNGTEATKNESEACQTGTEQWCEAIDKHMPLTLWHTSAMVRAASVTCFAGITSSVFFSLMEEKQDFILSSLIKASVNDEMPSVRSAACRAIGVISCFPQVSQSAEILAKFIPAVEINTRDPLVSVRITASWALANICDSIRHCVDDFQSKQSKDSDADSSLIGLLIECALHLTMDGDKIKSNAVRALGNLSRFVKYTFLSGACDKPMDYTGLSQKTSSNEVFPSSSYMKGSYTSNSLHPASMGDPCRLERMVQAFISCVTTGNVKVQWNVCHALSNLFLNETLRLQDMDWAPSVFSILLLLLRNSSNFKIRIQAAAALAVPASIYDYGKSFPDVIQGLENIVENLGSDQISEPSSFKYRVALEKQLTSTMLHVLSLASSTDHEPLKDFLVKKASFLEEWFKVLCLSLGETSDQSEFENIYLGDQKKEMISKALRSLIEVFKGRKHHSMVQKLEKLDSSIW